MTSSSVVLRRLALGSVGVGALAILIGNCQLAMGRSLETQTMGYAVRHVGLLICTITAILFLVVRVRARLPVQRYRLLNAVRGSAERTNATGPSQALIASIRVFCMFLFFLGVFSLVSTAGAVLSRGLGRYRFGGIQHVVYLLLPAAVLLVSGFLIWCMMNVIVRMSQQLDKVASKVDQAHQRMDQLRATNPGD